MEDETVKITRVMLLALILCLALVPTAAAGGKPVIYYGEVSRQRWTSADTHIYKQMDKNGPQYSFYYGAGRKINITMVTPGWVEIKMDNGDVGYILRQRIDVIGNANPGVTPDYPIWRPLQITSVFQ